MVGRGEEPRRVQFAKGRKVPLVSPTAPPSKSQNPPFWPLGGSVAAGVLPACVERTVVSWFGAVLRSSVPPKFQQGPALTLASPAWKGAAKPRQGFPCPPCLHYAVETAVVQHWEMRVSSRPSGAWGSSVLALALRPRCPTAGLAWAASGLIPSLPRFLADLTSPSRSSCLSSLALDPLSDWLSAYGPLGFSVSSFAFLKVVLTSDT